ncbi:MAG: valine--tRNA ligase [Candidatus Diapherotrites archaeon]|nr:valine--tRNA ligase [Candidatus Diapherotrites archaeon]
MRIKEKRWQKKFEEAIWKEWVESKRYRFETKSNKPVFSIDTPPPYVNTPIHIGHATTYAIMDMFARFKRMLGYNVLFPLGLDRNGLPIEMAAEKRFNVKLKDVSRQKFLEMCKQILEEASIESIDAFKRLGISFNSFEEGKEIGDMYLTDSPEYRALTQSIFIDLWQKGLIYEDKRIANYCPGCRTTIADSEIVYELRPTKFNHIKFKVKETGEEIVIATTRPELLCTCAMVLFHPEDKRYKHLEGKHAITPLYGKEVPIKAHPIADPEKGTGLVMMCSMGDLTDIRFFREQKLKPVIAIDENGRMNRHAGFLEGLTVKEAREKIIEELKKRDLIVKQEQIMHRTPVCERSNDEIEFIETKEFYLKQVEFKKELKKIAKKLNFFAEESRQILLDWIDSIVIDWPISRRRYYATEIPLWYCKKCKEVIVPEKGKYYQPWKEKPPIEKCPKCNSEEFIGEQRVFDTWFDSSNTPLYILGYERFPEFFKKHKPCSLRPQGKEIIRTWLYYTLLKGFLLLKEPIFKDVWINFHILDEKGKKMSKSKGNVIDPKEILKRYGAEPFRLWATTEGNLDRQDFRCSFERIESNAKTLNKLWNVARFISNFEIVKKAKELQPLDKLILAEFNRIVKFTKESYENYDFHNPAIKIRHFLWESFASHYIELAKTRAYNKDNEFTKAEQKSALFTLHYILANMLKLLAPIIPFITYKLYKEIYGKDVHAEEFPKYRKEFEFELPFTMEELEQLNSEIWKIKKEKGLALNAEIKEIKAEKKFKIIEKDLLAAHKAKRIIYT